MKGARQTFEGTAKDIQVKHLHANPGGLALPLGAIYAHLILSEDMIVNEMLRKKTPLYTTTFKGKTGVSKMMPSFGPDWEDENKTWSKTVRIELPKLRKYSKAVYKATDAYLDSLKDSDLDKEVDLGSMGKQALAEMISGFLIGHTNNITGEISVLKGIQGAKGYPF